LRVPLPVFNQRQEFILLDPLRLIVSIAPWLAFREKCALVPPELLLKATDLKGVNSGLVGERDRSKISNTNQNQEDINASFI